MRVIYSKEESIEEYLARMNAQDEALKKFVAQRRLIRQIVIIAIGAIGLIVVLVIMAIH